MGRGSVRLPDRITMSIPIDVAEWAEPLAWRAVELARMRAPRLSGEMAANLDAVWGPTFIGIRWEDDHAWFQESGTRPFTMRSLAGKTIPMWLDDPTGELARENPKAEVRMTPSGREQVLIFRRVAKIGSTREVHSQVRGQDRIRRIAASYPGAPGRIVRREAPWPYTSPGRVGGQIAKGNVGVRWRHPGGWPRNFMRDSLHDAVTEFGIEPGIVQTVGAKA